MDNPMPIIDWKTMLDRSFFFKESMDRPATFRQYFKNLLLKVWVEGPLFDGKRPWGNSSWQHEVYVILIKQGVVDGKLDENDYIETFDRAQANEYIRGMILCL